MSNFLTYSDIDSVCLEIINRIEIDYPYYLPHVRFMYYYGCRIGECFDYRINFVPASLSVQIIAQKKNNIRYNAMVNDEIPGIIEQIQITQENNYINKRNLQRIIEKVNPYRDLKCGNKKIGAHIFRHNWIRKQVISGRQYETINEMLGYTTQKVQDTYLTQKIYW